MYTLADMQSHLLRYCNGGNSLQPMPGLRLRFASAPTPAMTSICEPTFAMVVQGKKRTLLGNTTFEYGAGQCLVVPVDLPIVGQILGASEEQPYIAVALVLKPARIAAMLLELSMTTASRIAPSALTLSVAPANLIDAVARFLRLLDCHGDIEVLGPMLEREILWRLLTGEQQALVRAIGMKDSRLAQVNRAILWIRAHYAAALQMDELAEIAGMAASTFYRQFRAVTAMSPLQYQKQIRLLAARAELMSSSQDAAQVAFSVGYGSASQFSREYARAFGAAPARDAGRLRA